jgi:A/G-specific adenine glycosylase
MLQQTRVEAVREPYRRFLDHYPTPASFAAASDDELLVAWRGLGYYRRARLLREGARQVVANHRGEVPADPVTLRELPGIGAYTLGAVASIAFGHREIAVDGNVERVIARHRGIRTLVDRAPARPEIRRVVAAWQDEQRPGDFNQAMMELGATVCTPTSPTCGDCPIATDCVARATGETAQLPVKPARRANVDVEARVVLIAGRSGVLGQRLGADSKNAGQIDLPGPGVLTSIGAADLAAELRRHHGARIDVGPVLASVRHTITHHRITVHAHAGHVHDRGNLTWFVLDDHTPWTTTARKMFRRALGADGTLPA